MIAALLSGVLIVTAWFLGRSDYPTVSAILFISAFVIGGYAKAKEGITETIEDRQLNVEILMILAAIGSAAIGYWTEGAVLIFIFAVSGALESYTTEKSSKEISSLMDLKPETAVRLATDGSATTVGVEELSVGDRVLIKPGERIPIDGVILSGNGSVDESAISGESLPLEKAPGDELFAGTINMSGALTAEVAKPSTDTLFQKIIELVQTAQSEKSPSQQFIERFEGSYVKIVLAVVALMMFLPHYLVGWDWTTTIYRAMVLLVVASPCALVASIMPATLSAISNGAKKGVLFKGGSHLENISSMKVMVFDKTGTLTLGKPVVTDFIVREGLDRKETLALLGSVESLSTHPLALAIQAYAAGQDAGSAEGVEIRDIPGSGLEAEWQGRKFKVGKPGFVGKEEAHAFADGALGQLSNEGKTVIFMRDETGILALAAMKDTLRPEAAEAIRNLKTLGMRTVMLTGDNEQTARAIAREAGVDEFKAECLPETKVARLKELEKEYGPVGMIGDGINDAPALATASTGIAMGDGTGVALETADVVLMRNDLLRIPYAFRLSGRMNRIVRQNIILSVAVISVLILSNFLQAISLPLGVIGHEGSTILVILNGLRLLKDR
ncbi:heavy metal translocating P-type ATPase [Bhargavaea cecembensis]|uniref:heavy metal translocating P-type ATPase n=1 Tax=Bhargavaea cecembensis TaxID=394098 RepID=UPI0006949F7A|nr:heavy metal translocating P-type ATPase [Bhargavaea cecembensis]